MINNNPVYSEEKKNKQHSLRYISIVTNNITWILNRISSLMRRKRYNIEEVSLNFDNKNKAHFVLAVDWELFDIQQIIHQIEKLHDVLDVYDATHLSDELFNWIYVSLKNENELEKFPFTPVNMIKKDWKTKAVFMLNLLEVKKLTDFLEENDFYYAKRLLSLI